MVSPNCLFKAGGQGLGPGPQLDLGRAGGRRGLQRVRAVHLAAVGHRRPVRDQARDARPDRRDLLDELLDGLHSSHRPTAVGTARQGHLEVRIDVVGKSPVCAGMTLGSAGSLFGAVGNLLGLPPPERGSLSCRGPFRLLKAVLELTVRVQCLRELFSNVSILCLESDVLRLKSGVFRLKSGVCMPEFVDVRLGDIHTRSLPNEESSIS